MGNAIGHELDSIRQTMRNQHKALLLRLRQVEELAAELRERVGALEVRPRKEAK